MYEGRQHLARPLTDVGIEPIQLRCLLTKAVLNVTGVASSLFAVCPLNKEDLSEKRTNYFWLMFFLRSGAFNAGLSETRRT